MAFTGLTVGPSCNKAESFHSVLEPRTYRVECCYCPCNKAEPFESAECRSSHLPEICMRGSATLFKAICTIELPAFSRRLHAGAKQSRRPKLIIIALLPCRRLRVVSLTFNLRIIRADLPIRTRPLESGACC